MEKYSKFMGESEEDELMILVGRLEALGSYLESTSYPEPELIAAMLGITIKKKATYGENETPKSE